MRRSTAMPENPEHWFWQQYYQKDPPRISAASKRSAQRGCRERAQNLAADSGGAAAAAQNVLLVMAYEDDFSAEQISCRCLVWLPEKDRRQSLEKLEKTSSDPDTGISRRENAVWLAGWRVLILAGADRQILAAVAAEWVDVAL